MKAPQLLRGWTWVFGDLVAQDAGLDRAARKHPYCVQGGRMIPCLSFGVTEF